MVDIQCSTAILRFPRRYPLSLLILLIPLALLLYTYYDPLNGWRTEKLQLIPENMLPSLEDSQWTTNETSEILLVSAFFPLSQSKHVMRDYIAWLTLFLGHISTDMYIFTTLDAADTVRSARGTLPITIDTTFERPFNITPLRDKEEAYFDMVKRHKGKSLPPLDEYASLVGKPFYLAEALRNVKPDSRYKYAFWVDATSFKSQHAYSHWPDLTRVHQIWDEGRKESGSRPENLLFMPMTKLPHASMLLWNENMGPIRNDFSQGSFFGGPPATVAWWEKYFYAYHNHYMAQHVSITGDESLANSLLLMHPERVITVWPSDPIAPAHRGLTGTQGSDSLGDCGQDSYYYKFWLASEEERDKMSNIWAGQWHLRWNWWTKRTRCRLTRVLAMEWLLRRPFGESWRSPVSSLRIGK